MMPADQSPRLPGVALPGGGGSSPVPAGRRSGAAPSGVTQPGRVPNLPQAGDPGGDRDLLVGAQDDHGALREPRTWRIDFPAGTDLLTSNQSKNWGRTHRLGTVIKNAATVLCRAQKIPQLPRASFVLEYQPPTKGRAVVNDAHNLAQSAKPAIDGCVKAGVLRDDSDRYVADVSFRRGDRHPLGRISLIITEVLETPS